jgi:thioredoxin-dependent peroxiredoxin
MDKRVNAVTFKGTPLTLIGPALAPGDKAPPFTCLSGLDLFTLDKTPARPRLFSVVPSLDTPVCSLQTKKFDEKLATSKDKLTCYTVSLDLPFAQKRFCTSEAVANMQTLSDVHNHSFGKSWGVLIEGLPLALLTRAVFVVNKDGVVTYAQIVPEVTAEPDYNAALKAIEQLLK